MCGNVERATTCARSRACPVACEAVELACDVKARCDCAVVGIVGNRFGNLCCADDAGVANIGDCQAINAKALAVCKAQIPEVDGVDFACPLRRARTGRELDDVMVCTSNECDVVLPFACGNHDAFVKWIADEEVADV